MIDDHSHPFSIEFRPIHLNEFSLDVRHDSAGVARKSMLGPGRLFHHLMTNKLATLLGVAARDALAERDRVAARDWGAWVQRLFDDAGIEGFLMDAAIDCSAPARIEEYQTLTGRPVWHIARVDPCIDRLIENGASSTEIVSQLETYMADSAAAGAVAFKSIAAYRTGLQIDPAVNLDSAARSLSEDKPVERRGKALRDLLFRTVLARCADLNLPLQVHTGIGDSDLRLSDSAPLLLEDVLRTPEGTASTVILIHGSFPFGQQAAYLAASRPNVWVEFSLSNLFAPVGIADRVLEITDLAPRGRIVMGTDGHVIPESHWFAARMLSEAWQTVAHKLCAAGADAEWVTTTHHAIMTENAKMVYGLSQG